MIRYPNTRATRMTADELLELSTVAARTELVRGRLVVREPAGHEHGVIAFRLARIIGNHVHALQLGEVLAAETGFLLAREPDTVRAPDVAFLGRDRCPGPRTRGYVDGAPDLAIEVLSPSDRPGETLTKVGEWLLGGSAMVWVVDPMRHVARVYRSDGSESTVDIDGLLDGEGVLPGLTIALRDVII